MKRIIAIGALAGAALLAVTTNALAPPPPPPPPPPISALINKNIKSFTSDYNNLSAAPATAPGPQLWVHVRSDAERQLVERNMPWLSSLRFDGQLFVIKPPVLVGVGPSVSQLRFFKAQDRQPAAALVTAMAPFIPQLQLLDLSGSYQDVTWISAGRLELWLAPNLKQFGSKP